MTDQGFIGIAGWHRIEHNLAVVMLFFIFLWKLVSLVDMIPRELISYPE